MAALDIEPCERYQHTQFVEYCNNCNIAIAQDGAVAVVYKNITIGFSIANWQHTGFQFQGRVVQILVFLTYDPLIEVYLQNQFKIMESDQFTN